MIFMNNYIQTHPFDVYELYLFRLVAQTGSFTKASEEAGLTQSAVTRQIKGIEDKLGVALFERTTRHVLLTSAGEFLLQESEEILNRVTQTQRRLVEDFTNNPPTIKIGISRSIGPAYLPGIFVPYKKQFPDHKLQVSHLSSNDLLTGIEQAQFDVGLLCPPPKLPKGLTIVHRFPDNFVIIIPADTNEKAKDMKIKPSSLDRLGYTWLLINRGSNTGRLLHKWLEDSGFKVKPEMEIDNFELILNLVSLGLGASIIPNRTLAPFHKKHLFQRVCLEPRFRREIVVVTRKDRKPPTHINRFVESMLF